MSRDIRVQCKNKIDGAKWWICKGFGIDRIQVKFMSHKIIQWSIVHVEKCRHTNFIKYCHCISYYLIIVPWTLKQVTDTVYNGGVRETYNKYIVL
jgi:hypothetical protein